MRISTYKPLGQYRIASMKDIDNAYRLMCSVEYYILQKRWPFIKKVGGWTTARKAYGLIIRKKYTIHNSVPEAEQTIAQLEEVRLRNELGRWTIIKSINTKNELMGPKVVYDKESDQGYIYLTEKQVSVEISVPSSDNLFVLDFDENDQLIGIEFNSLERLIKFIRSNISLSVS